MPKNLFEYEELRSLPGFVSLDVERGGFVSLSVRSPGAMAIGKCELDLFQLTQLRDSLNRFLMGKG